MLKHIYNCRSLIPQSLNVQVFIVFQKSQSGNDSNYSKGFFLEFKNDYEVIKLMIYARSFYNHFSTVMRHENSRTYVQKNEYYLLNIIKVENKIFFTAKNIKYYFGIH